MLIEIGHIEAIHRNPVSATVIRAGQLTEGQPVRLHRLDATPLP